MADFTPHQRKIVERYYDNRELILLNRLQEIVTELFLAESQKKQDQLWSRAEKALAGLDVPKRVVEHILSRRDPQVLAKNLKGWLAGAERRNKRRP